jgi:2,4-dienoyl-CoA reductase-like NADH-dependent reductase (Old Yellow Enzyme family)/thioredoxin reductase
MSKKIFEPIEIKGMKLKNRLGFAPFLNMPAAGDGHINDLTVKWFEDRAKGGTAFIMTGAVVAGPAPDSNLMAILGLEWIGLYDDKYIPGFARIADAVHAHGAKLGVQLTGSAGPMLGRGPSLPPYPDEEHATDHLINVFFGFDMPVTEVTVEEIEQVEQYIADAAARAKAAGVDCVELHCAHGGATFHNAFLSPYYNRRTDRYGGSWEGRLRLLVETVQKMRAAVGEEYPILVRLSSDQLVGERGVTLKDTTDIIVPALEAAGVDCFDISQGDMVRSNEGILIPLYYPRGCFMNMTAEVKKATKLPVIGVGRIVDLDMADRFLEEGKADIIFMGRQLTADPETPKKYLEGRPEDIRVCIGCMDACGPCAINYEIHRGTGAPVPADKPKKVLVIGGGIGGMEAARVAALRGHSTTLMENDSQLGGILAALARSSMNSEFGNFVRYLTTQLKKLKVDVRLGKPVTAADVEALAPDIVILATGSSMVIPKAARGKRGVMNHVEAVRRKDEIGQKVVIWGLVAADLALSLAQEGKDVTIMGEGGIDTLAKPYPMGRKWYILRKLTDVRVPRAVPEAARMSNPEVLCNVKVEQITEEGIHLVDKDGGKRLLAYDTLIASGRNKASDAMFKELQGKPWEVYRIGDCIRPANIKTAVVEANEVARRI